MTAVIRRLITVYPVGKINPSFCIQLIMRIYARIHDRHSDVSAAILILTGRPGDTGDVPWHDLILFLWIGHFFARYKFLRFIGVFLFLFLL